MKSIDELRKTADQCTTMAGVENKFETVWITKKPFMDMLDAIEREVEERYIELPKDADGVPIHIGDVMDGTCPSGKHVNGTVNGIGDGVFWLSNVQFSLKPDYMHHYHAPTVKDVLRELAVDWDCAADGEDKEDVLNEYAAKLQIREG